MPTKAKFNEIESQENQMPLTNPVNKPGTAITKNKVQVLRLVYNFAVSGGAVSNINLVGLDNDADAYLPQGALVVGADMVVATECTSGGSATIALGVNSAGDVIAAEAVASFTAGAIISLDTKVKASANVKPFISIADAALTAGKINVYIQYIIAE